MLVVVVAYFEYSKLKKLREDFEHFKNDLRDQSYRSQKAIQRVMASYQVTDSDMKISLLKSAIEVDRHAFNVYNTLGYAYLEKGDVLAAIDAFKDATVVHPKAKEGWFDLAGAYLKLDPPRDDLARSAIQTAIKYDSSAVADALADPRFMYMTAGCH